MKKLTDIKAEIAAIQAEFKDKDKIENVGKWKKSGITRAGKRVTWLRFCANYCELFPKEQFLKDELGRVENAMLRVKRDAQDHFGKEIHLVQAKYLSKYYNDNGMKVLRLQEKTLKYLMEI